MSEKLIFDYSKLLGKIKEKGYTQKEIAEKINICETTFISKLKGKRYFTSQEIYVLSDILECNDIKQYFFNLKV